jgi:hypothetical protein
MYIPLWASPSPLQGASLVRQQWDATTPWRNFEEGTKANVSNFLKWERQMCLFHPLGSRAGSLSNVKGGGPARLNQIDVDRAWSLPVL